MLDSEPEKVRLVHLIALALVAAAVVRVFVAYRDCGFLGWDTYPMIEVSRVRSPSDLLDLVSSSLMGKDVGGLYYRPLPRLSLAIDYALWDLWAPGYQLTSALLFGTAVLAIYLLARRLIGGGSPIGPLVALAFFLTHPVHANLIPVPARRADVLCLLFMSLSLAAQARAPTGSRRIPLLPAALAALALASKETAFLLPPLALLAAFLFSRERVLGPRVLRALTAAGPVLAVGVGMVLVRTAVLGGIIGERPLRDQALVSASFEMMAKIARSAISPTAVVGDASVPIPLLTLFAVTSLAAGLLAVRERRPDAMKASIRPVILSAAWVAAAAVTYAVGRIFQPWYLLSPTGAIALLAGAMSQELLLLLGKDGWVRGAALAALACLGLLVVNLAAYSPLFRSYDDWERATGVADKYLDELRGKIEAAPLGSVVRMRSTPLLLRGGPRETHLSGVTILAPYSVEGWVRLSFPERSIRVSTATGEQTARPDEILVLLGEPQRGRALDQGR